MNRIFGVKKPEVKAEEKPPIDIGATASKIDGRVGDLDKKVFIPIVLPSTWCFH